MVATFLVLIGTGPILVGTLPPWKAAGAAAAVQKETDAASFHQHLPPEIWVGSSLKM